MIFTKPYTRDISELLDKFSVKELIEFERFCRDNCLWEQMHECFAENSTVTVSWYQGDGRGFVEASKKMKAKAPHKLNNTLVWVNAERAVAVTMASVQVRTKVGREEFDLTSYVRLLYTTQKRAGTWEIVSMDCIYEKDSLVPVSPKSFAESHKPEEVHGSYENLSKVLKMEGCVITENLPGDDNPVAIDTLLEEKNRWLRITPSEPRL